MSTVTNSSDSAGARQATATPAVSENNSVTRRGGHPSRQKRFGPAPLASFEDLPTDDQDSSPENKDPIASRSRKQQGHPHTQTHHVVGTGQGRDCGLRLELLDASPRLRGSGFSGSRAESELSTPVAPESDVVSQITITPTADSRNVSPFQGASVEFGVNDPLAAAAGYGSNATAATRSSLTASLTEDSSYREDEDVVDGPDDLRYGAQAKDLDGNEIDSHLRGDPVNETMAGQIGVTHATIEIIHEEGCQPRIPGTCSEDADDASGTKPAVTEAALAHTAITSEAILESLLKFEEERIPLAARLERSCQSIADIPSASQSRKNSSTLPHQQGHSPLTEQAPETVAGKAVCSVEAEASPSGTGSRRNDEEASDPESLTDNKAVGQGADDDDEVPDLSSSAGPAATRRRRRKLRPQTSDDRFESLRLLPAQDSLDVEEDDEDELQALGLRSGPEVQIDPTCCDDQNPDFTPAPKTPQKQTVVPASQRQQLVTIPIERPRSTTPINVAPFEAYIQQQEESIGTRGSSQNCSEKGAAGSRSPDRLKLTLPGQHVGGNMARSPRKGSLRNWEEFCGEALQHSPRARSKSDAAALGQRFFPDPLEFSPASPPRPPEPGEDEIQSPSDYQDPFRRRLTCSCRCSTCSCLCGGCDCDCHFYTQKVFESHLNDPMSRIAEINGTPGSPREDEQSLLSPDDAAAQGPCLCECHSLPRDTSCLLTAPLLVAQSSLDSC